MGAKRQGMTGFSIGEVEQITSVKAHVLGSQTNGEQDFIPQLNQIRSELLDLYRTVHKAHREANE